MQKKWTISYPNLRKKNNSFLFFAQNNLLINLSNFDRVFDFCSEVERRKLNLTFPITINPTTWDAHLLPVFFGGSVLNDDLTVKSVPSVQLGYFITVDSPQQDQMWVHSSFYWVRKYARGACRRKTGQLSYLYARTILKVTIFLTIIHSFANG